MGLLDRHVSVLKSEEFVLGVSTGFKGTIGKEGKEVESTKMTIVSAPASKNWTGFTAIDHSISDSTVGAAMVGKQFPARCLVSYQRRSAQKKTPVEGGGMVTKDIEELVVTSIEYLSAVDLVDIKIPVEKKAA